MKTVIIVILVIAGICASIIGVGSWIGSYPVKEIAIKATVLESHQSGNIVMDNDRIYVKCEDGSTGVVDGVIAPVGSEITIYRVSGHWMLFNNLNGLFAQPQN